MRDRAADQVSLVFIRHGETKANEEHRYLGKTDELLSKKGIQDLLSYKDRGIYPKVRCLFSSPMKRCLQTAKLLYPDISPEVIPEWEETDFGRFEYKNYQMLKGDAAYQAWIDSGGTLPFPGGESREEFLARCERGFRKMCEKLRCAVLDPSPEENPEETAAAGIIVHGGTIMALLSLYGEKSYFDYQVGPGGGYICRISGFENIGGKIEIKEIKALREEI